MLWRFTEFEKFSEKIYKFLLTNIKKVVII